MLYRTTDKKLLILKPDQQLFVDENNDEYYIDHNGIPLDSKGVPLPGEFVTKMTYSLEEYIEAFPEAESFRNWLQRDSNVYIIQSVPNCGCMPGFMYNVKYFRNLKEESYSVLVNDGDDAYTRKIFSNETEAIECYEDLKNLAPFDMRSLNEFGFVME